MGDILKAIYEDGQDYLFLCKEYGETPVMEDGRPSPYCDHAKKLKERNQAEQQQKDQLG